MAQKKVRHKKNQKEKSDEIANNLAQINEYNTPSKAKIKIDIPERNEINKVLFIDTPCSLIQNIDAKEKPTSYYATKVEIKALEKLFNDYSMPKESWADLKFIWINMVFSNLYAPISDLNDLNTVKEMSDLYVAYDLLNEMKHGNVKIKSFNITYKKTDPKTRKNEITVDFKSNLSAVLFHKMVNAYINNPEYISNVIMLEEYKNKDKKSIQKKGDKKNNLSRSISHYNKKLNEYLNKRLYLIPHQIDIVKKIHLYDAHCKKIEKQYPQRKIDEFIGHLMQLSGLMNTINDHPDIVNETLSQRLKKRR
jgi:hypothetical protein